MTKRKVKKVNIKKFFIGHECSDNVLSSAKLVSSEDGFYDLYHVLACDCGARIQLNGVDG